MATAKQQPNLDAFGEEARKVYKRIADASKDYNTRRRNQTEELRDALKPVWEALGKGQAVNGCKDKLSWCKWANSSAKHPERYFYKVMSDKGLNSVQSKRHNTVVVRHGLVLSAKGLPNSRKLPHTEYMVLGKNGFDAKLVDEKQHIYTLEIRVKAVMSASEREAEKVKSAAA